MATRRPLFVITHSEAEAESLREESLSFLEQYSEEFEPEKKNSSGATSDATSDATSGAISDATPAVSKRKKTKKREEEVIFLPSRSISPYARSREDRGTLIKRSRAFSNILKTNQKIVFSSFLTWMEKVPEIELWHSSSLFLYKGMSIKMEEIITKFLSLSYKRQDRIEVHGDFCVKGSLLEIFIFNEEEATRLDFFGDKLENIWTFDVLSQRNLELIESVCVYSLLHIGAPSPFIGNGSEGEMPLRETKESPKNLRHWSSLSLRQKKISPLILLYPADQIKELIRRSNIEIREAYEKEKPTSHTLLEPQETFYTSLEQSFENIGTSSFSIAEFYKYLNPTEKISTNSNASDSNIKTKEKNFSDPKLGKELKMSKDSGIEKIEERPSGQASHQSRERDLGLSDVSHLCRTQYSSFQEFQDQLLQQFENGSNIYISSLDSSHRKKIEQFSTTLIGKNKLDIEKKGDETSQIISFQKRAGGRASGSINLFLSPQRAGFSIPYLDFYLLNDRELLGQKKRRALSKGSQDKSILSLNSFSLKEGDYVVHMVHGIGRFLELRHINSTVQKGEEMLKQGRDFLILQYADRDRLFVPLEQMSLVQRYISHKKNPRLDHLGRATFKKTRAKIKERIDTFARELLELHAIRSKRQGYQFPADSVWQREFEEKFPYEETDDQLTAIEEIKRDMESTKPMDRLICGDVSYGKTEVAIRCIFKAIMAGRQVALLAPTTVLVLQHFGTISKRFSRYSIKIDHLSRFKSKAQINKIKKQLQNKEIDLIIGTHALLRGDISMPQLGLFIIDEEQRFGVKQKELLRRFRSTVDTLALSATPIPRTLYMSLIQARDISIIKTPPYNRKPVKNFILTYDEEVIVDAIRREIRRGGQVFYVHNRIFNIEGHIARLKEIVPEISITLLHGKMDEKVIEETLLLFQKGHYDLLVSTSIIENGIDMPRVNTLIVDRADTFGLSQLYQIRGRVGRSDRQAYAYFFYPKNIEITDTAKERLRSIEENESLGSGLAIAMRDLEIRGAGNVIGTEQSGNISEIGYELYMQLLNGAIALLQKKKDGSTKDFFKDGFSPHETRCAVDLHFDLYISENYIKDLKQRIEFYKRFEKASSGEELKDLVLEMEERFGKLDPTTRIFTQIELIRILSQNCGFSSLKQLDEKTSEVRAGDNFQVTISHFIECLKRMKQISLKKNESKILYYKATHKDFFLEQLVETLSQLSRGVQTKQ